MSKVCPRCGSSYEGNVCPFCDYEEPAAGAAVEQPAPAPAFEEPAPQPMFEEPAPQPAYEQPAPAFEDPNQALAAEQPAPAPAMEEPAPEAEPLIPENNDLAPLGEPGADLDPAAGLGLEGMMGDLANEFGDLAQELEQTEQEADNLEDYDVYAKVFPDWDLLPPKM